MTNDTNLLPGAGLGRIVLRMLNQAVLGSIPDVRSLFSRQPRPLTPACSPAAGARA